jgi:hypothetical protein
MSLGKQLGDGLGALTESGFARAEDKRIKSVEVHDATAGFESGGDDAQATENVLGAEALVEKIEVAHSIEQRQDERLQTHGGGHGSDGAIEVIGFATEQNEIEGGMEIFGQHGGGMRDIQIAIGAANFEAKGG